MIPLCVPEIKGNEWRYVKDCLDTNWVSTAGSYVDKFETEFAKFLNVNGAVTTVNGTAALELALRVLGIGAGDEVIVPSFTFISPVNTIKYVGAEPVFVDVLRDTWVLDTDKIEEMITENTRAILPVHLYGHPVEMNDVIKIAKKYNLFVIEDATESLGSLYEGKQTGTIGHIGCFSFNGNKMITTGGGGMLVSNNEEYTLKAKYLSTQTKTDVNGIFYHKEIGYNYRLPNLLSAMGVAQLENLAEYIKIKREHALMYNFNLRNVENIKIPIERSNCKNCFWLYGVLVEKNYNKTRDELHKYLESKKIQTRPFFLPVHKMPPYVNCKSSNMDITNEISEIGLSLPSSVGLTEKEIEFICSLF